MRFPGATSDGFVIGRRRDPFHDSMHRIDLMGRVLDGASMSALRRQLCDTMLELQSVCSETDRFAINSIDLSSLSVDAVDEILSRLHFI
jgi:hypothetical protein